MQWPNRLNRRIDPPTLSSGFFLAGLTAMKWKLAVGGQRVNLGDQREVTFGQPAYIMG